MSEMLHSDEGKSSEELPKIRLEIRKEDIYPELPEAGGTVLVLQRNAKDDRSDPESPEFGALVPEAAQNAEAQAEEFFDGVYEQLTDEEKKNVFTLVFASDVELVTPYAEASHRRAFETAEKEIIGIEKSMKKNVISSNQLLNNVELNCQPIGISDLVDLTMFKEHPEFVKYLKEKYGTGKEFWVNYEMDTESDTRLDMGAEGPNEIAIRMRKTLTDLTQDIAKEFHAQNPDSRLIIWAVSHYDSISPFVKGYVYQADSANLYVPVEHAGGITVKISRDNKTAETTIGGQKFEIPSLLRKPEN